LAPGTIERPRTETSGVTAPIGNASPKHPKDGLNAFAAETMPAAKPIKWPRVRMRPSVMRGAAVALVGIAVGAGAAAAYQKWISSAKRPASLTIETVPSGLDVSIDGASRGRTPLTLTLPPRTYEAVIGSDGARRVMTATLAAGTVMVQRLELTTMPASTHAPRGILFVDTIPTALPIKVDGTERGPSPLMLENVTPGEHEVALGGRESLRRKVTVHAGETLSLLLTAGSPAPTTISAGWVTVEAPVALQIREGGRLLGTTESDRLLMPAGNHTLDFVNADLGFSQRVTVNVTPGKESDVRIKVPNGTLSLNAQPWADVWIDGTRIGETPIGNLVRPIGRHEVVFRHPELGERRETVMVTALQPARLGVDLRRKTQ
jgi:hypothetical protein